MEEWKEYKLGSLTDRKIGYGIVQPGASIPDGVPVIKVNNIISGLRRVEELETTSKANDAKYSRTKLEGGELIISVVGTVGKTAIVPTSFAGCNLVRATCLIDIKDKQLTSWVKYYIDSPQGQRYIHESLNTTVQPTLNIKSLVDMPIPLYSSDYMEKVVNILKSLDDKIEVNRRINENLEQQAQALFKSWFVDFDPFKDQPFVESELGMIPQGWKVGTLHEILNLKRDSYKKGNDITLPYMPIDIIPMHSLGISEFKDNKEAQSSLQTFEKNDIVIGAMRVYFHRVVIAPCKGITRNTCFVLKPRRDIMWAYCVLQCNQEEAINYANRTSKGSTMPYAVWENGFGNYIVAIPTDNVLELFNKLISPMLEKIRDSYKESRRLAELRDTLLPRLMSGELEIKE